MPIDRRNTPITYIHVGDGSGTPASGGRIRLSNRKATRIIIANYDNESSNFQLQSVNEEDMVTDGNQHSQTLKPF